MGAGIYKVRVIGELDSTRIRKELDDISRTPLRVNGALGGIGVSAGKAVKGVKGLNGQLIQTNKNIKKINSKNLNSVASASEKSAKGMRRFASETLGVTKKVIQFGAITAIIRGVTSGIGDMVKNVYELDGALTEFKKVSDLSGKGLERYTDQAYKVGKTVARTGTEMIQAATEFKKSGFSEKDSLELGRVASMYQNVADVELSAGDAANFIVSQMKAFNMTAQDSEHIIDAVNQVSNNFAVSSADIATNIGKASAAMATGNVTYEQSVGLMTAMTEITRNGAKSARGLVSIQSRYNQIVDESSSTGKKLTAWYKEHNIAIKDQNGQLRSFYDVGADVAKIWDTLSDNEKRYYLNTQAGANQSQNLAALMRNYETAIDATNTALDSAGSAARENARYMDSMEGKLEALSSAWENFSRKIIDSDWLKKGMDVLTNVLEALSSDVGQAIIKYGLLFASVATGLNLIVKVGTALKGLSLVKFFSGIGKGAKEATDGLKIMQGAQVGATKAATPLYGVFGKLTGSLLGSAGLVAGIGLLSVALAKYVDIGKEAQANKADKNFKKTSDEVDKLNGKLEKNRKEWSRLREKQRNGEELTEAEQARLRELEAQTRELKRQLEIKQAILGQEAKEKWGTTSPEQLEGAAKDKYIKSRTTQGQTEQQALAGLGITAKSNRLDVAMVNYTEAAKVATKAENEYQQAVKETDKAKKEFGNNSEEYIEAAKKESKAYDAQVKAQKESGKYLDQLKKKRDQMYEEFGGKEMFDKNAPKTLQNSRDQLDKMIKAAGNIDKLQNGAGNVTKAFKSLNKATKASGNNFLKMSKDGKKIESINVNKLQNSMSAVGVSAEDTLEYLKEFGKAHPEATVELNGSEVAIKDLEVVDGQIQKVDGTEAEVDIEAEDNASAKMDKIKKDKYLGKAKKKLEESGGNKVDATMGKLTKRSSLGKAKKDIEQKGAESVQNKLNTITNKKNLGKANKNITQKGGDSVQNKLNTISGKNSLGTATKTIKFSLSGAIGAAKKFLGLKKGVRHFAAGGTSSILDNAEVNEQGFEIIQDGKTGLMRVANGGKRGTTRLNKGDTVYTHGQSVRMLQKAGTSEGKSIYGYNKDEIGLFGIGKLPRFAKGKTTPLTQKQYTSQYNAILSAYDKDLATLEYEKEKYHWSEKKFVNKYIKLKKNYNKKISKLNKKSVEKDVERRTTLGMDRLRALELAKAEVRHSKATSGISGYIEGHRLTNKELSKSLNKINKARKAQKISAEEATQYRKEAYKKNLEYNINLYKNDDKTYKSTLKLLRSYYNKAKITSAEYYQYREELAQTQLEKEKERLSKQQSLNQDTYSLAKGYVQKQIDLLEKENEEQEKQNELVELQNNLVKARNQKIRIYKEGEGFVYEQDTEAIREATQALQEYQSTTENPVLAEWKRVLELFDEYETDIELKALENSVGSTVGKLFGSLGTDPSAWAKWIKNNLSKTQGLQNVLDDMDKLVDADDIIKYLNKNGKVSDTIINAAIKNNVLPSTYASAITQSALEAQASLNATTNLATQSSISGATSKIVGNGVSTQYGNIYNFDNLVLPNVTNASQFINELDNLSTIALQVTTQRV